MASGWCLVLLTDLAILVKEVKGICRNWPPNTIAFWVWFITLLVTSLVAPYIWLGIYMHLPRLGFPALDVEKTSTSDLPSPTGPYSLRRDNAV